MMDDGPPIRFNGVEREDSMIAIGGGGAVYSSVETVPRQYTSIVFTLRSKIAVGRDRARASNYSKHIPAAHHALRRLVMSVLATASEFGELPAAYGIGAAMRDSLLAAVDAAVVGAVPARWIEHANSLRHFKIFRDIEEALVGHVGDVIYSADLAAKIGVSVRTMHEAVLRYRGMACTATCVCAGYGWCGVSWLPARKVSKPPRSPTDSGTWAISRTITVSNMARRRAETLAKSHLH